MPAAKGSARTPLGPKAETKGDISKSCPKIPNVSFERLWVEVTLSCTEEQLSKCVTPLSKNNPLIFVKFIFYLRWLKQGDIQVRYGTWENLVRTSTVSYQVLLTQLKTNFVGMVL